MNVLNHVISEQEADLYFLLSHRAGAWFSLEELSQRAFSQPIILHEIVERFVQQRLCDKASGAFPTCYSWALSARERNLQAVELLDRAYTAWHRDLSISGQWE